MKKKYQNTQAKSTFEGLYVILTDSNNKIANIAIISDVEAMESSNDLILDITGNRESTNDGVFVNIDGIFYKLHFNIVVTNISRDILKAYVNINQGMINHTYNIFEYCRSKNSVKQVKISSKEGTFLDWYSDDRKTDSKISSYDGIWFNGSYLRVLPIIPPSVEFNITGRLFEIFNNSRTITSISNYEVFVKATSIKANNGYFKNYTSINGIVIPDLKKISLISNEQIVAIDNNDEEFVMYYNKEKDQGSSVIA